MDKHCIFVLIPDFLLFQGDLAEIDLETRLSSFLCLVLQAILEKPFENIIKKEKILVTNIFPPFSSMFSTLSGTNFLILTLFELSSASAFDLGRSKIFPFD